MTSTLGATRLAKLSAVSVTFATLALAAIAASASRTQPCPSACEVTLPPCSWSEHYVNTSAASLAAVHVRSLRSPIASQPESLHCCGFRFPPSPQCTLRSLMLAAAWEDEEDSGRRHLQFHLHDVTAVLCLDQDLTAASSSAMAESSPPPLSWMLEDSERHSCGALDAGCGTCLPRSSAAPAMCDRELALSYARKTAGSCRRRLRRSPPSTSSAAHASPEVSVGNSGDAGTSFIGALYASYSVWELASVLCAIAWLLVCLAA